MRFLLLSACLAVTRAENVAMTSSGMDRPGFVEAVTVAVNEARALAVFGVVGAISGSGLFVYDLRSDPMNPTLINPEGSESDVDGRITSVASGGDVVACVTSDTGLITFVDLPDPLPESDHTNDDANAADDENVTGFPPVDDLTDGARGWRAAFAAAACLVALAF